MPGPLAEVATLTARINLDLGRALWSGEDTTLDFIRPDGDDPTGWVRVLLVADGWDRVSGKEGQRGDGQTLVFDVAEREEAPLMAEVLRTKDLHVVYEGAAYKVGEAPAPPSNRAQVFRLTCAKRTLRTTYFDNAK